MSEGLRKVSDSISGALARERAAFCEHIGTLLEEYEDLTTTEGYLPLHAGNLLEHLRDGVIFAYLLHHLWPGSIDLRKIVRGVRLPEQSFALSVASASSASPDAPPLSPTSAATLQKAVFLITANLNCVLDAARACKLVVVNIGAGDVMGMNEDLVLGLVWQIIRAGLLRGVDLVVHPELVRLLGPDESLKDFMAGMRPEMLLLRWFNYHLRKAETVQSIGNWGRDLQDSTALLALLDQLFLHRHGHSIQPDIAALLAKYPADRPEDRLGRAAGVIDLATRFGLDTVVVTPVDIAQGHPRLNLVLAAALFNCHIGISLPSEEDISSLRRERDELHAQSTQLRGLLESASRVSTSQYETLVTENRQLTAQLEEERSRHEADVVRLTAEFQAYRDELAAQYRDSLESSISGERRTHQEELWQLIDRQNGLYRLILTQASLLHRHASKDGALAASGPLNAVIDAFKTLNIRTNAGNNSNGNGNGGNVFEGVKMQHAAVPPEDWMAINFELIEAIARRNRELNELSSTLHKTVAHKEHVNEIMGAKIREFTEEYIKNKAQDNGSAHRADRASSITRIFSFRK